MLKHLAILFITFVLFACKNAEVNRQYPKSAEEKRWDDMGRLTGDEGITLGGKKKKGDSIGITVNSYLWRAALEATSEMPIAVVDPFSGVITTEWYQPSANIPERFKLNVIITSDFLRADAIKVNVFKQTLTKSGAWLDSETNKSVALDVEDKILTRARQLKITDL